MAAAAAVGRLRLARGFSQLAKANNSQRAFLVDTLGLVRELESKEIPTKQAEAIASSIVKVLNDSLENVSNSFASKADNEKEFMKQKAEMEKFQTQLTSSHLQELLKQKSEVEKFHVQVKSSQENHGFLLERKIEKLLADLKRETEIIRGDLERMSSQHKTEIDKLTVDHRNDIEKVIAGQRLDLNLARGHMRDEHSKQEEEIKELDAKIDRETHAWGAQLMATKYDVTKYCIGTLVSISAIGVGAIIRILM